MKLIVFDLDGTLLNTLQDLTDSVNYAMDELRLNRYTNEQVRMMIGNGVAKLTERAVAKQSHLELKNEALSLQRQYYLKHSDDHTVPYDGILDMLSSLKQNGYIIAVHTNKDENAAELLCEKHFNGLIDYVCGTTGDGVTKPNPLKVEQLMLKLGVSVNDAVYCGDSDVDIATADNSSIKCISVTWGFRDVNFLKSHGARYFAKSPREVVEIAAELH